MKRDSATFACGHPRTPENSRHVGIDNGVRCKICREIISKRSREKRAKERAA